MQWKRFRITGPLWGESTGSWWFSLHKGSEMWTFGVSFFLYSSVLFHHTEGIIKSGCNKVQQTLYTEPNAVVNNGIWQLMNPIYSTTFGTYIDIPDIDIHWFVSDSWYFFFVVSLIKLLNKRSNCRWTITPVIWNYSWKYRYNLPVGKNECLNLLIHVYIWP